MANNNAVFEMIQFANWRVKNWSEELTVGDNQSANFCDYCTVLAISLKGSKHNDSRLSDNEGMSCTYSSEKLSEMLTLLYQDAARWILETQP